MKKSLLLLSAVLMMYSCTESTEDKKDDKKNSDKDTTQVTDTVAEVVETKEAYSIIEDYTVLDTKEKLVAEFGAENLVEGSTWYGEGSVEKQHSVLTNPENGHIVKFVWDDDNKSLAIIEFFYQQYDEDFKVIGRQTIGTECGVRAGMTLKELKEWNGSDFKFSGFAWDFAGNIIRKEGDKISNCKLMFNLDLNDSERYKDDDMLKYMGDVELSTADKGIMDAPIVVNQITYFNPE